MEQFSAFCKRTGLHGWQYLGESNSPVLKRCFWFVVIFSSIISAAVLIYYNTVVFQTSTVLVSVETMTAPLSQIYFPSVTVCNINQARKSFFEEMGISENATMMRKVHSQYFGDDDSKEQVTLPPDLVRKLNASMSLGEAHKSLHWAMHQKCGDMFILSKWNGMMYNSSYEIDYDFGTDYGICCWFTPQLNLTQIMTNFQSKKNNTSSRSVVSTRMGQMDIDGHWFAEIKKGATAGKHNGYKLLFDIETFDYNYYDEGSEGLKVINFLNFLFIHC